MNQELTKITDAICRTQLYLDQGRNKKQALLDLASAMDMGLKSIVDDMDGNSYLIDIEKSLEMALEDE